jgi:hypothetical protein
MVAIDTDPTAPPPGQISRRRPTTTANIATHRPSGEQFRSDALLVGLIELVVLENSEADERDPRAALHAVFDLLEHGLPGSHTRR